MIVDISNWQAGISFDQLKAAGVRAAICKASEHTGFKDPNYDGFRAEARRTGIIFGSYHFGRPDDGVSTSSVNAIMRDARQEAEWYLACATPATDEIVALDLEKATPLSVTQLYAWTSAWLDRVETATGQAPLIYTNPNFWTTEMGDSTDFGYYPLWLSAWGPNDGQRHPASPLPGWTQIALHQYTSKGVLPGVTVSPLDLNWLPPEQDIAALQIGLQPVTVGDAFSQPWTVKDASGAVLSTSKSDPWGSTFAGRVQEAARKSGVATVEGTRKLI